MTWISQVVHVWRRDVLHLRWYLLAYAVCVVALVARGFAPIHPFSSGEWLGPLLVIVAMFTTALAIHADAAASDHALWRALPLDASAVAAAKLCLLLSLVAIGLAGQHLALLAFNIPVVEHLRLGVRASVAMFTWLIFSALAAAYTRNIQWYLTLMFLLPIFAFLISWFSLSWLVGTAIGFDDTFATAVLAEFGHAMLDAMRGMAVIAAAGVLLLIYTRRARRWVSASIACVVIYVGFVLQIATTLVSNTPSAPPKANTAQTVHGEARWRIDVQRADTAVVAWRSMPNDAAPTDRVVLEYGTLVLRFSDSSLVRVALREGEYAAVDRASGASDGSAFMTSIGGMGSVVVAEPRQIASTGLAWPAEDSIEHRLSIPLVLSAPRRADLSAGRVEAWLEGDVQLLTGAIAIEAPLSVGASSTSNGFRLQVHPWRNKVVMSTLSFLEADRGLMMNAVGGQPTTILIDEDTVVRLPSGLGWVNSGVIVLPGVSRLVFSNILFGVSIAERIDNPFGAGAGKEDSTSRVLVLKWENPRRARLVTAPSVVESATLQNRRTPSEGTAARAAIELRPN